MRLGLLDLMDTTGLSEEDKKQFELLDTALGEAFDKKVKSYLSDELKIEDLRKSVEDAQKSIEGVMKKGDKALDKDIFEKKMASLNEALVRLKAATEKGAGGDVRLKSIGEQIGEQLKAYVVTDGKGNETLDLREACKKSPGNKLELKLFLDKKTAGTISSGSFAPHFGQAVDTELSVAPRAESVLRRYANVAPINARTLVYAEYVSGEGDAAWVAEGSVKPLMDADLTEKTVTAAKVAVSAKFTEETLSDLPSFVNEVQTEMINKLGLKEEDGILNGTGSSGQIKGVAADMPAFSLDSFVVDKANMFDSLVAAYSQIISTSEMAYRPNLVLMNPLDYAQMQLAKDLNGQYLRPFRYGDELVQGMRVETTTTLAQGEFIMGDFSYLNIRDVWGLTVTVGWENDDFTKNLVTVIAEKRLMCYIKSQYKTAFLKDSFDTVIEAITPADTVSDDGGLGAG